MSDNQHGEPNPIVNALSNAVAALRADEDQLALAKAHEALHPKAIEKLSVEEARRQPTVADAVHHLLTLQGRSTDPEQLVPGVRAAPLTIDTNTADVTVGQVKVIDPEAAAGETPGDIGRAYVVNDQVRYVAPASAATQRQFKIQYQASVAGGPSQTGLVTVTVKKASA